MSEASKKILSFTDFIQQFFHQHQEFLTANYPGINQRIFLQKVLEFSRLQQIEISSPDQRFYAIATMTPFKEFFAQVLTGVPFEYLVGKSFFYRSEFSVTNDVLIPRSETEILVELAVNESKKIYAQHQRPLEIADIGTGSGAIILSLLRECPFSIKATAVDICPKALAVAKRNDFALKYTYPDASSIEFKLGDRLAPVSSPQDLIVSNPPYIKRERDKETVHDQVDQHEPHLALYLDDEDYGQWYKELFDQVKVGLKKDGVFIMEGHEDHLQELSLLAQSCSLEVLEIKKDYTQRDRFLVLKNK